MQRQGWFSAVRALLHVFTETLGPSCPVGQELERSAPQHVSSLATELLRLDRDEDEPAGFPYRLSDTTLQLVRFGSDNC